MIFKHLVGLVDPGVTWVKKFEDDALLVLRDLRYPAMDTIGRTGLSAPGAPNCWPSMLAMLNWLVDMHKVCFVDFAEMGLIV